MRSDAELALLILDLYENYDPHYEWEYPQRAAVESVLETLCERLGWEIGTRKIMGKFQDYIEVNGVKLDSESEAWEIEEAERVK